MSLPCSVMRAGPSVRRWFRSCGTIFERTRSLTGCFELESEWMSISNWFASGKRRAVDSGIEQGVGNVQRTRLPQCRGLPREL